MLHEFSNSDASPFRASSTLCHPASTARCTLSSCEPVILKRGTSCPGAPSKSPPHAFTTAARSSIVPLALQLGRYTSLSWVLFTSPGYLIGQCIRTAPYGADIAIRLGKYVISMRAQQQHAWQLSAYRASICPMLTSSLRSRGRWHQVSPQNKDPCFLNSGSSKKLLGSTKGAESASRSSTF